MSLSLFLLNLRIAIHMKHSVEFIGQVGQHAADIIENVSSGSLASIFRNAEKINDFFNQKEE